MAQIINLDKLDNDLFKNSINFIVIGFFDGVHKGHKEIIKKCVKRSRIYNGVSIALTFDNPPINILNKENIKKLLISFDEKAKLISEIGIDYIVSVNFNEEFSNLSEYEFCKKILLDKLNAFEVFVGENFRFGKDAKGDFNFLKSFFKNYNVKVYSIKLLKINNEIISSTKIRSFYKNGDIDKVKLFLGRYPTISGIVQKGFSRGRLLGFPTANIIVDDLYMLPKNGVYIGRAILENEKRSHPALINIGNNPTFGYRDTIIEVFILNFYKDIYNKSLTVRLMKYLRQEKKFNSSEELSFQINEDIKKAKIFFSSLRKNNKN